MARAPSLGFGGSLTPFGGGGVDFSSFNIVDTTQGPYLAFLKVEDAWSNGKVDDTTYLAALRTYADALPAGTSNRESVEQRIVDTTYRVQRNTLVHAVETGQAPATALVDFDRKSMVGENPGSQDFLQKQDLYWSSQQQVFSDAEQTVATQYQNGQMTSAQLQSWYKGQRDAYADNPKMVDAINKQITQLDSRILDERDAQTINNYNDGKMSDADFLAYASAARARYASGTSQASDWASRIDTAQKKASETGLLYRYGLSQQYQQLEQFVKSNAAKVGSRTSTSTSTRTILGADGHWHTVTTTSSKSVGPTPAEQAAYKKLQIQLTDAKRQMGEIAGELGSTPGAKGFVTTQSVLDYYTAQQAPLIKGSADWYAYQTKIDSLHQQLHMESVLSQEGIKITYPSVGGSPAPIPGGSSGGGASGSSSPVTPRTGTSPAGIPKTSSPVSIDSFMRAIASVESGGDYTARNKSTGAYGKYQIMPSNWPAWAQKYLGSATAQETPANQEAVAKAHMLDLYKKYGNWESVAYVWNTGARPPASGTYNGYVTKVMGNLGVSVQRSGPAPTGGAARPSSGPTPTSIQGKVGGLTVITGIGPRTPKSSDPNLQLKASAFPVNLDGQAFLNFYRNYTSALEGGKDSFVDSSTGHPVTYFIGDNAADRSNRMAQLDQLRISYYQTVAQSRAGTPSGITASKQLGVALKDAASHQYRILDEATIGSTKGGVNTANVIASTVKVIQDTEASIKMEQAAAQAAFDRGDITEAYAHLQLAADYSKPLADAGSTPGHVASAGTLADQAIAKIEAATGYTPEQALGKDAAATFRTDLTEIHNAIPELTTAVNASDELAGKLKQYMKLDAAGHPVLDSHGQIALADGYGRFVTPAGKVDIQPIPTSGVSPDGVTHVPKGYTETYVKVGTSYETVYAPYHVDQVGGFRDATGKIYRLDGKVVDMTLDGKRYTFVEDPFQPGHWNSVGANGEGAIVYNMPAGLQAVPGPNGTTLYQFKGAQNVTYSFQLDPATGTYTVVGNRPGFGSDPGMANQPVGSPGDANVLALMASNGITPINATISGGSGFLGTRVPIAGMTPDEYARQIAGPESALPATQNALQLRSAARMAAVQNSQINAQAAAMKAGTIGGEQLLHTGAVDPWALEGGRPAYTPPAAPATAATPDHFQGSAPVPSNPLTLAPLPKIAPLPTLQSRVGNIDTVPPKTTAAVPTKTTTTAPKTTTTAPKTTTTAPKTTTTAPKPIAPLPVATPILQSRTGTNL